jgi:LytS/YehU family sensor histidine kinase
LDSLFFFIVGHLITLVIIILLLRKLYFIKVEKIKAQNEEFYLMQLELIKNQLDPHFLFNALNSISFSINKDDRKTAYSNLGLFSKFLRESIVALDEFSRPFEEELDYVQNYLLLEKFRFKEKFDYDFIVSPDVNMSLTIPKLILFSFIESALKKGVLPQSEGGEINVLIDTYEKKGLYISIFDTGIYRNIEDSLHDQTKNIQMIKRIISYFNHYNPKVIEIKYKDMGTPEYPKGSKVEITIPADYIYID